MARAEIKHLAHDGRTPSGRSGDGLLVHDQPKGRHLHRRKNGANHVQAAFWRKGAKQSWNIDQHRNRGDDEIEDAGEVLELIGARKNPAATESRRAKRLSRLHPRRSPRRESDAGFTVT